MATNNKSIFSINMKRAREKRGWTQEEAARKIGIKQRTLASYEEDRARPKHDNLGCICHIYGIENWVHFLTDRDYLPTKEADSAFS